MKSICLCLLRVKQKVIFIFINLDSKYSKLDVEKEIKSAKEGLVKELGLKNESELYADIDQELNSIDLSSNYKI